jgi:hypothetical protein
MLLNKQQIRDIDDLPSKIVHMPEWGGDIKIRTMSAKHRIEFEKLNVNAKTELETIINLIMFSCVNQDDSLMFDKNDFEFLSSKSAKSLMRIFEEAVGMSTLTEKKLEEKAKNS